MGRLYNFFFKKRDPLGTNWAPRPEWRNAAHAPGCTAPPGVWESAGSLWRPSTTECAVACKASFEMPLNSPLRQESPYRIGSHGSGTTLLFERRPPKGAQRIGPKGSHGARDVSKGRLVVVSKGRLKGPFRGAGESGLLEGLTRGAVQRRRFEASSQGAGMRGLLEVPSRGTV
ncbi:hypothetical protein M885DRAFT_288533 [Pelagophyceae sp. CCMP2097]|nr:hypothetical protein M885DRAFT_288533 [Pelagophyceae sp. CCMP2097]